MKKRIALFDWDGTIRKGFTITEWGKFLDDKYDHRDTPITETIDVLFSKYWHGNLSHDQLADKSAHAYAKFIAGLPVNKIEQLAIQFVKKDQGNLYSYASEIFKLMEELNIYPIIISGCPEPILKQYSQIFNFDCLYGLRINKKNNHYSESLSMNPGVSSGKKNVVGKLPLPEEGADIAFGNSSSDMPLFEKSKINVVVNNPDLEVPGRKIAISEEPNTINLLNQLTEELT